MSLPKKRQRKIKLKANQLLKNPKEEVTEPAEEEAVVIEESTEPPEEVAEVIAPPDKRGSFAKDATEWDGLYEDEEGYYTVGNDGSPTTLLTLIKKK